MKSMFKRNLLVAFGISMLLLVISSIASYSSIRNLLESSRLVSHTHEVLAELQHVVSLLKDAETAQQGYLLTADEAYLVPYGTASDNALANIGHIKTLTPDNSDQQVTVLELKAAAINRVKQLQKLIDIKKKGIAIQAADLVNGRRYMDEAMRIIDVMKNREENLLKLRTDSLNLFSTFTPYLILALALLSFVMAIVSYIHLSKEMEHQVSLLQGLEHKEEVNRIRLNIIQDIAEKIAAGHYSTRINGEEKEKLGNVAASLNKMVASLEYSFGLISDKEWLQTGIAGLHDRIMKEYDLGALIHKTLAYIAEYTGSRVGAYYQVEGQMLKLAGGYALMHDDSRKTLQMGEDLAGQCAASAKMMVLEELPAKHILISFAAGNFKPFSVAAVPVVYEGMVMGVMELGSLKRYSSADQAFLQAVANATGIAVTAVESRRRIICLLEETKAQACELREQQHELQSINEELEAQTQKLQASEEELRVQQEELMEANQELEEGSRQLEEKNQLIHERNISIQGKAEELATASRYKSEFLTNMSHELRTPLNSILLLSRLMKENKDRNLTPEQVENAAVILSSGQGLLYLIDEILDLSRIEAGRMDLHYEPASVQGMLDDLHALFAPVAREKGVALHMNVHDHVPTNIETDRLRLLQVLRNLLSNAFKFTSNGSVSIDVQPPSANGMIALTVRDTGIGIHADKQHMIFDAFQQADGSTHRKYGGTGLGLSISRELVRLMGGYIQLESRPDEGSAFTVCIPPSKTASHEARAPAAREGEVHLPSQPQEEIGISDRLVTGIIPKNIPDDRELVRKDDKIVLIVEDDTAFARTLLEFTHARGYKGIVAVRGDEALALAKEHRPLAILLDIQLPVKDGWEVMEELKKDPLTRHIPVHVMSSYEARAKSISRGAIDFANKPLAPAQMEQVFHRIEHLLSNNPRKVLIVEENTRHAKALSYFLESSDVNTEIRNSVGDSINTLKDQAVSCVILDMGVPDRKSYDMLEEVKGTAGLENIPIIIFTGKSLSRSEELRIRQYADSIVIKTAHSYQRILDEVSLFLHVMKGHGHDADSRALHRTAGALEDVLKGKTVLVADDDVRNIYSLTHALESAGMHVVSATDGREALRQLKHHPQVNIVLMDMMMPEMDGFESIRRIRSGNTNANMPVIAVTAKAMTGDREKCIEAGASDYITKPVDIDQLLSLLRVWLYDISKH